MQMACIHDNMMKWEWINDCWLYDMLFILVWLIFRLLCDLSLMRRCCFFVVIIVNDDYDDYSFGDYDLLIVWM